MGTDPAKHAGMPPKKVPLRSRFYNEIKIFFDRTAKSKFARDVAIVASGTAVAQAITMVFAPIVTRLYGPEAFGLYGVFMAVVAVLTPIAALTYPIAVVLPEEDSDAKGLAHLSLLTASGVALLLVAVIWFSGEWFLGLFGAKTIAPFGLLLPLALFFAAGTQVGQHWLIRKKRFAITARIAAAQALVINTAKVGVGWFHPVGAVLIVLATFGGAVHSLMLWVGSMRANPGPASKDTPGKSPYSLGKLATKYYDFPLYRAPQVFMNAVSQSIPVLMLAGFFSPAAAGFYTIGRTVLGMPSQLIAKSVGDVFYPRISEAAHKGENLVHLILQATGGLALTGVAPFMLVVLFGPWLFGFVFGAEWAMAGSYARWLAFFFFFNYINRPSVAAVPVLGIQKGLLIYELFSTGSKAVAFLVGFYVFSSDIVAVALFALIGSIAYVAMILWIIGVAKVQEGYAKAGQ
ncbi:MAG: lipopolysaccharide biosynthesis protein [Desulfobacterales bacterium]|nr:lipopolysaccharide biosynthesis protein [Desulfobacterales bacterium]